MGGFGSPIFRKGPHVRVHKDIGEIGIHTEGREVLLKPSLYAMASLGEPREIVETFALIMGEAQTRNEAALQRCAAAEVLQACHDGDICDLTGYYEEGKFVEGEIPAAEMIILARSLMRHGIVGALPPLLPKPGQSQPQYTDEFEPRTFVSAAIAHLGMNETDAWNLTMTSLAGALRAKYPPEQSTEPGAKAPSKKQFEAAMSWADKVDAARRKGAKK